MVASINESQKGSPRIKEVRAKKEPSINISPTAKFSKFRIPIRRVNAMAMTA
jgi:hypothetical protein